MPSIPFAKAGACGNDFLIVDIGYAGNDIHEITRQLCDRHTGVGADGVEWLIPSTSADIEARLVNADGSDAEISGNGTRCVAACVADHSGAKQVRVQTGAGVKTCTVIKHDGHRFEFKSAMGKPEVGGEVTVNGRRGLPVWMGNPQFVAFYDEFPPQWQQVAIAVQASKEHFPNGVNVIFMKVIDRHTVEIRIFERGAGETQSSGTGSSSAAVAAIHVGKCESPVRVRTAGGAQTVEWEGEITLTGPATIICTGEFFI